MQAERIILETDHLGNLKQIPKLPPNKQIEAIFLVVSDCSDLPTQSQRSPHPDIAGKLEISGDIFDSVPTLLWNLNDDRT